MAQVPSCPSPQRPRPSTAGALLSLFLGLGVVCLGATSVVAAAQDSPVAPSRGVVASVYDGDTFTLSTGEKVRVSGINAPEMKPLEAYGVEAREATAELVLGKSVDLVYGSVKRDSYGRLLAWVRVSSRSLELELLERGLAHIMVIPPLEVGDMAKMQEAQTQARRGRRGIWSQESFQSTMHITSFHANAPGDDRSNINGEYLRICNISDEPINVDGYRLVDSAGNGWPFPPMIIPVGHTVKVHSGEGEQQTDASMQLEIFLGASSPIWNNDADRAALYDRYGKIIDVREHKVENASN